jgi:hypothetical protein
MNGGVVDSRLFRPLLSFVSCLLGCADALTLTPFPDAGLRDNARDVPRTDAEVVPSGPAGEHAMVRESVHATDARVLLDEEILARRFGSADDPSCDLNGYWAAKQVLINQSDLAGEQQTAQWFYLVLAQHGDQVTVIDHHDCGLLTRGVAEAVVPRETLGVLARKNSWRERKAQVVRVAERCEVRFQRAWSVRGADPAAFLPRGVFAQCDLDCQREAPLPSAADPAGAEDWNGQTYAKPGFAMSISGATSGTRWTTQRLYSEWFSSEAYPVVATAQRDRLTLGASFDAETHVLSVEPPSPLLQGALARPDGKSARNRVELLFLGRTASEPRASAVVRQVDRVERCLHIQNVLLPY